MATLNDEKRLRRQLRNRPEDATHRCIYADLLEELGEAIGAKYERSAAEEIAKLPTLRDCLCKVRSTIRVSVCLDDESGYVLLTDGKSSVSGYPSKLIESLSESVVSNARSRVNAVIWDVLGVKTDPNPTEGFILGAPIWGGRTPGRLYVAAGRNTNCGMRWYLTAEADFIDGLNEGNEWMSGRPLNTLQEAMEVAHKREGRRFR